MNIRRNPFTRTIGSLSLTLALAGGVASAQPQPYPGWGQSAGRAGMNLQLASGESDSFALSRLAGKPLRGANQEHLGNVSDFLIEPKSGQVHYAVVPSGAGAGGETFRLVPMGALDHAGGPDGLTVRLNQAQWDKVGTMTQAELPARVTLNDEQRQRLTQQFALNGQAHDAGNSGELVRASSLRGQALRSGNDQVGTIEDVAVDVRRRTAAAMLKTAGGYMGAEQRFLIPFQQLQWNADANAGLTTTLGRNEFQQAQGALSPTGYTGAPFTRGAQPPHLAQANVQQAVNQAAGSAGVQVAAETWLILRGTVDSEQKRAEVERAAQQAAPGMPIDNKVTVQNR